MSSAHPPPPRVRVTLPDGQELLGYLHERREWRLAGWMYRVGLPAWANDLATEGVEPREYRVWLKPGEQVHPIEGVAYDQVPKYPLAREEQDSAPPSDRWAWKIARTRPRGGRPGKVVVHIWDCSAAPAGEPEVDLFEALEVMRSTAGAVACKEFGAAVALHPLLEAP
ncbi:DUF6233 domain-containing protein [Streptomyces sp. NBC_00882]|uniref:DUF6233 domain-containing protein n=1 Tax=Streptomyces sp. NBC_00882 TaxID=2975856 RepID=UPI003869B777|nr:DUF6233 domain-containing protein [Streptomyces sp. NBC_00882]WSZ36865.1 DUF6233 domain-containing protein [Streptomyces sp. NBC_00882]